MERFTLASAVGRIDFRLLVSDNVRNKRGFWGETLEINFPKGVIFIYVDENDCGFIKAYRTDEVRKIEEVSIKKENLEETLSQMIDKAKAMFN